MKTTEKEKKKSFLWITQPYQSKYRDLHLKEGMAYEKDMKNELYFPNTPEGREEAIKMLRSIKQAIYECNKSSAFPRPWITEAWKNKL